MKISKTADRHTLLVCELCNHRLPAVITFGECSSLSMSAFLEGDSSRLISLMAMSSLVLMAISFSGGVWCKENVHDDILHLTVQPNARDASLHSWIPSVEESFCVKVMCQCVFGVQNATTNSFMLDVHWVVLCWHVIWQSCSVFALTA